jgi:hypothetical protein
VRISFDLDDTLICYQDGTPYEPRLGWPWRTFFHEPLRRGARQLMHTLALQGWELWVYTTSHRAPRDVKWWLWCHGIRVRRVINQDVHERHLFHDRRERHPSKNPRAFGIDLHVDDSEGVAEEGRKHGFEVVVVSPTDPDWAEKVLSAASSIERDRRAW